MNAASIDDIAAFDRDILTAAIGIGPASGRQIQDRVAECYAGDVNHSRLYTALGRLADKGLLEKRTDPESQRANLYVPTDAGRNLIARHWQWTRSHCADTEDAAVTRADTPPEETDTHA